MLEAMVVLAFAATALVTWEVLRPKERVVARRMQAGRSHGSTAEDERLQGGLARRLLWPTLDAAGKTLVHLLPQHVAYAIEMTLVRANSRLTLAAFLAIWAASIGLGVLALWRLLQSSQQLVPVLLIVTNGAIVIMFGLGPYLVARQRMKKRQQSIRRSLPYALDLLVTCVEAGLGVDAAIATVTEKTGGALSETLVLYLREVGLGRSRREALARAADQTGVSELVRLAASVAQAEEVGTTMGDVLRIQAADMRLAQRQRAQTAAARAPVLMTIPLTTCFLPALVAVTVVPALLSMGHFIGRLGTGGLP